jgi:hypothetical protein
LKVRTLHPEFQSAAQLCRVRWIEGGHSLSRVLGDQLAYLWDKCIRDFHECL